MVTRRLWIPTLLATASLVLSTMGLAFAQDGRSRADRAEPAPARTPSKLSPARSTRRVNFAFEDAALPELVRFVARVTGRRFILTGAMRTVRVTIVSERPVTPREAYRGFLAVLEMHGLTVVREGRYHRIIDTHGIAGRTIPVVTDRDAAPRSDGFLLRMHRVRHGSVEDAAALLTNFSSPGGSVVAHLPTRQLLITDTGANIRRMLAILDETHAPAPETSIYVQRLRHADARAMAKTLRAAMPSGVGSKISGSAQETGN